MILKKKVKVASNLVGGEGKWGLAGIRKVGWGESSADMSLRGHDLKTSGITGSIMKVWLLTPEYITWWLINYHRWSTRAHPWFRPLVIGQLGNDFCIFCLVGQTMVDRALDKGVLSTGKSSKWEGGGEGFQFQNWSFLGDLLASCDRNSMKLKSVLFEI